MDPIVIGAIVQGAATLGQTWANWWSQNKTNYESQEAAREAYAQQRRDALADWERTNAYNSPTQQMNRLRQAGLNPHLVYGKGAENTAAMVRSSDQKMPQLTAPKADLSGIGESFSQYYSNKATQAQTDNVYANTELAKKQQLKTEAETAKSLQDTATNKWQLDQNKILQDSIIKKANLENIEKQTSIESKQIEQSVHKIGIQKTLQEIVNLKSQNAKTAQEIELTKNMQQKVKAEATIHKLDAILKSKGIQPHDAAYMRAFQEWLKSDSKTTDVGKWLREKLEEIINNPDLY